MMEKFGVLSLAHLFPYEENPYCSALGGYSETMSSWFGKDGVLRVNASEKGGGGGVANQSPETKRIEHVRKRVERQSQGHKNSQ